MTHLEFVDNLTAISFINAFRRFIARRGTPKFILSDNATNFVLASKVLRTQFLPEDDDAINEYFSKERIEWKHTVDYAPWQGALYERLIGIIKNNFRRTLSGRKLTFENFVTFLVEVEGVINARPLTYVDDENHSIIRPIDFIQPHIRPGLPNASDSDGDVYFPPNVDSVEALKEKLKQSQRHINRFWELWRSDYLTHLREQAAKFHKTPRMCVKTAPNVNDVVLIEDENMPRGMWKMGLIVENIQSNDGMIRSAKVRIHNNHILKRPISALYISALYIFQRLNSSSA